MRSLIPLALWAYLASLVDGQIQSSAQQSSKDPIVRLTVNLAQVDAVVIDSKGRHVPDLTADDFEVLQDGKPQKITHFSYVSTTTGRPAATPPQVADKNAPPAPRLPLHRDEVRRTIAIVVDDLGLSWDSMVPVRDALKKFVDRLEPGDMVAILRTSTGVGLQQSFTNDRRQILAAVDRINMAVGRGRASAFRPLSEEPDDLDDFHDQFFTVGALGSLRYVIDGLRELPGRKSVVFISDGFTLKEQKRNGGKTQGGVAFARTIPGLSSPVLSAMQKLVDLANRSSVVLYTLDPRGLPSLQATAADRNPGEGGGSAAGVMIGTGLAKRSQEYVESQDGINYLANQTGGLFLHDNNDLAALLGEVLDDQPGYYLLGYNPGEENFNRDQHRVKVRVIRRGLHIRFRQGFYGVPEEGPRPAPKTRAAQLLSAISSPFAANAIGVRLTGFFSNEARQGSVVTTMLHIDARDLTFTQELDGTQKATVEVLLMTFGDYGMPIDHSSHSFTLRAKPNDYAMGLRNGFLFTAYHPVKKPGAYQLRAAVRDPATERVGAASQFIEVPDISTGRLAMSGILLQRKKRQSGTSPEGALIEDDPQGTAAIRIFHAGEEITYTCQILNAKSNRESKQASVDLQVRLFHDGKLFHESPPVQVEPGGGDPKDFLAGGMVQLRSKIAPGNYVLQLVAKDRLAAKKDRTATQCIDFEVVN